MPEGCPLFKCLHLHSMDIIIIYNVLNETACEMKHFLKSNNSLVISSFSEVGILWSETKASVLHFR